MKFDYPRSLGRFIAEEYLAPHNLDRNTFAERLGWPCGKLDQFLDYVGHLDRSECARLAEVIGTSTQFLINMQHSYFVERTGKSPSIDG